LFIGSAGSYTKKHKIFDIVESSSASQIELSFLEKNSYTPIDNVIKATHSFVKDTTIINSSNYISTNFDISSRLTNYNITLENMEFFSIVKIAEQFNIRVGGIFIVTNYCNKNAHQDFIKNHQQAKTKLTNFLKEKNFISDLNLKLN
jgi:nucleoside phosphorylase